MQYDGKTINAFQTAFEKNNPNNLNRKKYIGHSGNSAGNGPYIQIHLVVDDNVIKESAFKTYGCPACIACSQAICELTQGKTLPEAQQLNIEDLIAKVGQLPRAKRHCSRMALEALHDALEQVYKKLA